MPTKIIAASVAGCLALAGAWALVASPDQSNASATSTIPQESGTWEPRDDTPPEAPEGWTLVNSTVCFAWISHASLDHSPVCTIAQDHAQGVNQPHNTIVECGACAPERDDERVVEETAIEKTVVEKTIVEKTIVENHTHDQDENTGGDGDTTYDNDTTTNTSQTQDDTCTHNQETTCDQSEDNRQQECHQANGDALVNVNVCNVQVDLVKDVNTNDGVDGARDDIIMRDPDAVDAQDAVDVTVVVLGDDADVDSDSVDQGITEHEAAGI